MAAPKGNKNAAKGKEWADSIKWALENYEGQAIKRGQALRKIAMKAVEQALEGDRHARSEIGDRLDGKPVQDHNVSSDVTVVLSGSDAKL